MRLLNVFRPKWKHSDFLVRLSAVQELVDEKILEKVARTDKHRLVRAVAAEALRKARTVSAPQAPPASPDGQPVQREVESDQIPPEASETEADAEVSAGPAADEALEEAANGPATEAPPADGEQLDRPMQAEPFGPEPSEADTAAEGGPLHAAARQGKKPAVALLLSKGADVDARDSLGATALHISAARGAAKVAEFLVVKGAEINAVDSAGRSPLHAAAEAGNRAVAELLIDRGADVAAADHAGSTPLDLAEAKGHAELAELLRNPPNGGNLQDERVGGNGPVPGAESAV